MENDVLEAMVHYEEMKDLFALDLYTAIIFKFSFNAEDKNYKKYSDKEITIEDIIADGVQGEWKYFDGLGEIMYE